MYISYIVFRGEINWSYQDLQDYKVGLEAMNVRSQHKNTNRVYHLTQSFYCAEITLLMLY